MSSRTVQRFVAGAAILLGPLLGQSLSHAQGTAASDARAKDRGAIAGVMQGLAKSFEGRDAKGLVAHWTTEGEYSNDRGVEVQGREALEKAFAALFEKTPEVTAKLKSTEVRFLSADTAIDEGTIVIQRGAAEATTNADYTALLVREGGNWLVAQLSDEANDDVSIEDLAWLIGDWKTKGDEEVDISTTYSWDDNKKFIHVKFTRAEKELKISGTQIIGVNPATGQLHTWTFETDGGVGEANWNRDGNHWTLDAGGMLADGTTIVETNVIRRVGNDLFTWQSIGRALDGEPLPDLSPVQVSRVKAKQ